MDSTITDVSFAVTYNQYVETCTEYNNQPVSREKLRDHINEGVNSIENAEKHSHFVSVNEDIGIMVVKNEKGYRVDIGKYTIQETSNQGE